MAASPAANLANAPSDAVPELVTFTGFLGETVRQPGTRHPPKRWRLLYLDLRLQSWLLIEETGIVHNARVRDDTVPGLVRERDVVWVRIDASVASGGGPQSVEARFLTGEFTRAGDFEASPAGGTYAAVTGDFCRSPMCCYGRSR
jgi:hypothetical protein